MSDGIWDGMGSGRETWSQNADGVLVNDRTGEPLGGHKQQPMTNYTPAQADRIVRSMTVERTKIAALEAENAELRAQVARRGGLTHDRLATNMRNSLMSLCDVVDGWQKKCADVEAQLVLAQQQVARLSGPVSQMVREFHERFGVPVKAAPSVPSAERCILRLRLIDEEVSELRAAMEARDLVEIADALGDIEYVLHGAALECGIPLDEVSAEVHRSNMTKVWPDGTIEIRADGKIMKPPTYSRPRIAEVLASRTAKEPA